MTRERSIPVVLRVIAEQTELLVFTHPFAGTQLVKGRVEAGETPDQAAIRELREEAGLKAVVEGVSLGSWDPNFDQQMWTFWLCTTSQPPPDVWEHFTQDDGGLLFKFYWHPLHLPLPADTHCVYQTAVSHLRATLQGRNAPNVKGSNAA